MVLALNVYMMLPGTWVQPAGNSTHHMYMHLRTFCCYAGCSAAIVSGHRAAGEKSFQPDGTLGSLSVSPCRDLLPALLLLYLRIQQDATIMTSNEINPKHARSLTPSLRHSPFASFCMPRNLASSHPITSLQCRAMQLGCFHDKAQPPVGFTGCSISGHSTTDHSSVE